MKTRKIITVVSRWLVALVAAVVFLYFGFSAFEELSLQTLLETESEVPPRPTNFEGVSFASQKDLRVYLYDLQRDRFYPWAAYLRNWHCLAIVALAAGFLGGLIREVHSSIFTRRTRVPLYSWFGLGIAALLAAALLLLPKAFLTQASTYRPEAVSALCLSAGCFSEESWVFLKTLTPKIFTPEKVP